MAFFVYILTNKHNGVLYTGQTSNLPARVYAHKSHAVPGFTDRYNCTHLVWFESHMTREAAPVREKQIKRWRRSWKIELIEAQNPDWQDLYEDLNN